MFHIEAQIDQQEQYDQIGPMVERHRYRGEPDLIDCRGNDAENEPMRCCLGNEVSECHAKRHARILPRVCTRSPNDDHRLEHGHDQEDWQEHRTDGIGYLSSQLAETQVELHLPSPRVYSSGSVCRRPFSASMTSIFLERNRSEQDRQRNGSVRYWAATIGATTIKVGAKQPVLPTEDLWQLRLRDRTFPAGSDCRRWVGTKHSQSTP